MDCFVCVTHVRKGQGKTICEECRAIAASEHRCRSSERCEELAGHGTWASFCARHAAEIAAVRERWFSRAGNVLREPREVVPATPAVPTSPNPAASVTREELAAEVARHVREAQSPLSYSDLGERVGMPRNSGSLKRAVDLARSRAWIDLHQGRGFVATSAAS